MKRITPVGALLAGSFAAALNFAGSAAAQSQPQPPVVGSPAIAGGWSAASNTDPAVRAAADFAASQLPGHPAVRGIAKASHQVVAGMNYRMELTLADGTVWDVTVYRHFSGSMQLSRSVKLSPLAEPKLTLERGGLRLTLPGGTSRLVAFGASHDAVMAALPFRPEPGESTNAECGAGPVLFASWPDGVNLLFQDGKFGGWSLDERANTIRTTGGVGIGTTLAQLRKKGRVALSRSTLGNEFVLGGISGLLDGRTPRAKVSALWTGLSCNFR